MTTYSDGHGATYTDEDIERWAAEEESAEPYSGEHIGLPRPGRPISVGEQARPFTLRLDADRRAKLDEAAGQRHITPSQLLRDLIDTL